MAKTIYQITEYGSFITGRQMSGYITLPPTVFEQLENFIGETTTDALEFMGISFKKGIGKIITAKNYIGVLTFNDGTTIEILPKIASHLPKHNQNVKKLVMDMIKSLTNVSYKSLQVANVDIEKMPILDLFIRMFLDEVFHLVKHGLLNNYETTAENRSFFKGKILFSEQLKYNISHKERAFTEFDEFTPNCPENRLVKSTLLFLYKQTRSLRNKTDLKTLLAAFGNVPSSVDYAGDFSKVKKGYGTILLWCQIFLTGKSFSSFSGSGVAFALLFPMETLFERYVAMQFKKILPTKDFSISIQDTTHHLFSFPQKKFLLKPDIVITRKQDNAVFICDTKWKLLSTKKTNFGISQADLYQVYVYQKKYNAKNITLLYPMTDQTISANDIQFDSGDGVIVQVRFVDLFDMKNSLFDLLNFLTT